MSYGLTPYDKKSYKESKRRRRQALLESQTGRIFPLYSKRRKVIIAVCCAVALLILVCAVIFFTANTFAPKTSVASDEGKNNNSQLLVVVNKSNVESASYKPELEKIYGYDVNVIAANDLKQMVEDAKKQGVQLVINKAYVSFEQQQKEYLEKLQEFLKDPKYTQVRAQAAVQKIVPQGGASEAQTGLLIDFDTNNGKADSFLQKYCVKYGFVLRYPKNKEDVTMMSYSKSLYRYVGADNAQKIRSYDMCLEEYVQYLSMQK